MPKAQPPNGGDWMNRNSFEGMIEQDKYEDIAGLIRELNHNAQGTMILDQTLDRIAALANHPGQCILFLWCPT